jgi:hypothetical protein
LSKSTYLGNRNFASTTGARTSVASVALAGARRRDAAVP